VAKKIDGKDVAHTSGRAAVEVVERRANTVWECSAPAPFLYREVADVN